MGSIRRECADHVIVINEAHLRRILSQYFAYYHEDRAHLALKRNAPFPRRGTQRVRFFHGHSCVRIVSAHEDSKDGPSGSRVVVRRRVA